jgi:hypothetical protein
VQLSAGRELAHAAPLRTKDRPFLRPGVARASVTRDEAMSKI